MAEPCADDVSRVMTELDLNLPTTPNSNTPERSAKSLAYTDDELLSFSKGETSAATTAVITALGLNHTDSSHGLQTPPQCPAPPPPTPATPYNLQSPPEFEYPAPPPPTPATPHSLGAESLNGTKGQVNGAVATGERAAKKKKKKSSGKNKKAKVNPSGFEEFYCDPPTTPEEHETESDLYDPSREFHERIQTCIQRYRARRKLDEKRANIFSKYLILGGIEATNKTFTGGALDKETLGGATAAEIAAIRATDFIRTGDKNAKYYDPTEADKWVVDFEGIAKGFFSRIVPLRLGADTDQEIKLPSMIIRNFLNYVLQHNVCPEYIEDVMAARRVCDTAEKDLLAIKHFRTKLPGDFNIAASAVCGGNYHGTYNCTKLWKDPDPQLENTAAHFGFLESQAQRIFQAAIAFRGSDAMFESASKGGIHIVKTETRPFEVVEVERASMELISEVAAITNHQGVIGNIKPLGTMGLKAWEGPGLAPEDMSDDEGLTKEEGKGRDGEESLPETFWLEDEILQFMHPGLKMELVVHELNIGIKFFDQVVGLYCSFHTYLENEKLQGWKEPVPNDRAPPTEDDPDAEDRIDNAIMEDDIKADDKAFEAK